MSTLSDDSRLKDVARYAEERIHLSAAKANEHPNYAGPDYRWQHTLRVAQYGRQIAEAEGAEVELVVAACLLHDSEWWSDGRDGNNARDHGRVAAHQIRSFLEQVGYTAKEVDNICYSVAVHVDGEADFEHQDTLESKIVSDADNIDRFGAYRVLFMCLDSMDDYEKLIASLRTRLQRLEDYRARQIMETATGNRLFNQQLDLQMDFYQKLIAEHEITQLPN